jgi:hypothetical protein
MTKPDYRDPIDDEPAREPPCWLGCLGLVLFGIGIGTFLYFALMR